MKFVLYGMPCAGKTTLLSAIAHKLRVINGSEWLQQHASGKFSDMSSDEQEKYRVQYVSYIRSLPNENIISDGHYAFGNTKVFTPADGDVYDTFLYLACNPDTLLSRIQSSAKNQKFAHYTEHALSEWQNREIEELRAECHARNKDFYVLPGNITADEFSEFIEAILSGFSSYRLAQDLTQQICQRYPMALGFHKLTLVDGDKTFINEDSFRLCCGDYKTSVFDGDWYTGYQSYCFDKEVAQLRLDSGSLQHCTRNRTMLLRLHNETYIIISSGVASLWEALETQMNIPYVIASPLISADTKYYIAKLLRERGYCVKGYGDSKNDIYMLKEADEGYLCVGSRMSRSLLTCDTSGVSLLLHTTPYILSDNTDTTLDKTIAICKSNSGVSGAPLASAHFELGHKLGSIAKQHIPNVNANVIVLERGGRFFGDGFYIGFGGKLYPYNDKKDTVPKIESNIAVIVDSVINTGKSILNLIAALKEQNPEIAICIVTNVIQEEALVLLREYPLFCVRVSQNKFTGCRQKTQIGNTGPDTADRLFNLV